MLSPLAGGSFADPGLTSLSPSLLPPVSMRASAWTMERLRWQSWLTLAPHHRVLHKPSTRVPGSLRTRQAPSPASISPPESQASLLRPYRRLVSKHSVPDAAGRRVDGVC